MNRNFTWDSTKEFMKGTDITLLRNKNHISDFSLRSKDCELPQSLDSAPGKQPPNACLWKPMRYIPRKTTELQGKKILPLKDSHRESLDLETNANYCIENRVIHK